MPRPSLVDRLRALGVRNLIWAIPSAVIFLAITIFLARWLRELPAVAGFIMDFPGHSDPPAGTPVGIPVWLSWQHGLNAFFVLMIIRTGWLIRHTPRPPATWTRKNTGLITTKRPPSRMSIYIWLHLTIDVLWLLNGVLFLVLILVTGQWVRIVPTDWNVFPNALSVALQYASLDWPTEGTWVSYNGLQLLSYFTIVFIATPLAIVSGYRMSPIWPLNRELSKKIPARWARAIHFPVMIYFVAFIIVHVTMVLATGALRNLNHMYAARDDDGWLGFWIFVASLVAMVVAWVLIRPRIIRLLAALSGTVVRVSE
jgi:thiosulfate reductase cytochrome b subunit